MARSVSVLASVSVLVCMVACGAGDESSPFASQSAGGTSNANAGGSSAGTSGAAGTSAGGLAGKGGSGTGAGGAQGVGGAPLGAGGTNSTTGVGGTNSTTGTGGTNSMMGTGGTGATTGAGGSSAGAGGTSPVGGAGGADPTTGAGGTNSTAGAGGVDPTTGAGGTAGAAGASAAGAGGGGSPPVLRDTCPGEHLKVDPSATVQLQGSTATLKNDYSSGTNQCGGANSNDAVYAITPTENGSLRVTLDTNGYSGSLYARSVCGPGANLDCDAGPGDEEIRFSVVAGQTYYVFVDGYGQDNQAGDYTLTVALSVCGDKLVDPGETCDDGNNQSGDGCSAMCQFESGGPCSLTAVESNRTQPAQLPAQCLTANAAGVGVTATDDEWVCQPLKAGETWEIVTYQNPQGYTCFQADTVVEVYKGVPPAQPSNTSCAGSTAVACDDNSGSSQCSRLVFNVPEDGLYCARIFGKSNMLQVVSAYFIRR